MMISMTRFKILSIISLTYLLTMTCDGYTALVVADAPATVIREGASEFDRPEGVVFSPDGKYIATANSLIDTVTFYQRIGDEGAYYEGIPAFSIGGEASKLNYPHDIAFSPDGNHFAVANRLGNAVTIYAKDETGEFYNNAPVAEIKGRASSVKKPESVRYSPSDNVLAVANYTKSVIALFKYEGDRYEQIPYQVIRDTKAVLSIPDSIVFSSDGELMAVTSHDAHAVLIYQRIPDSDGRYTSTPVEIIRGEKSNLLFPHSVSFHPSKDYLIVTNSQGKNNVNIYKRTSDDFPRYDHKPYLVMDVIEMYDESNRHLLDILYQEGGCKGVSFSPDGKSFAVTQNLSPNDLKQPESLGALLVFPVEISDD